MDSNDGRVVSNFIVQALKNHDITMYGTGNQTRSFCYVDDLIDGIIKMMNSNDEFVGPVNLGNPVEFTMLELAKSIIKKTNSMSQVKFFELPKDDPTQGKPDITKAKTQLGWEPKIDLDLGLTKTIAYFSKILGE